MKRPSKKWPVLAPLRLFTTQLVYFLERNKSQNKDDNLKHVKIKYHPQKKTYVPVANFVLCQHSNLQTYKITKLQKTRNLQNTWSEWTLLLPSLPTTFCLVFFFCIHLGWHNLTTPSFPPAVPSFCETTSALEFGKPSTEKLNLWWKVVDQVQPKHFNPIGTRWDNFQN